MANFRFYMPSSHRADKLITLKQLPDWVKENMTLLISGNELAEYADIIQKENLNVFFVPEDWLLADKDQWMFTQEEYRFVIRIEDDLTFFVRDPETHKLSKATVEQVSEMFDECLKELQCEEWPLIGISSRGGNNFQEKDFVIGTRMHHIWFVDTDVYKKLDINLVPFKEFVMDDFHVILSYLRNGYPNKVYFKYACDDRGSNAPGGASVYRTSSVQWKSACWLATQHPGYVTVKEKTTSTGWEGMEKNSLGQNVRTDVTIEWKKAYAAGQSKLKRQQGFAFFNRRK